MTLADFEVQPKILRSKTSPEEYAIYKAALEWDLTDPIVIESKDDFKSAPRWRERLKPYQHQVKNLITFCRRLPVTLLADDVGLGKTISAGLIISELLSRSRLSNVLIVCPKLLGPQWQEELRGKFDIRSEFVVSRCRTTRVRGCESTSASQTNGCAGSSQAADRSGLLP
jgi:SNF2 family DNA or RNA helicase